MNSEALRFPEELDSLAVEDAARAIVARYPHFKAALFEEFCRMQGELGIVGGLDWLKQFESEKLLLPVCRAKPGIFASVETSDKDIVKLAQTMADFCRIKIVDEAQRLKASGADRWKIEKMIKFAVYGITRAARIDSPMDDDDTGADLIPAAARMACDKWWRRKLRTQQARQRERVARFLGLVNKPKGIYCSTASLWAVKDRKTKNRQLLEKLFAENESGQVYSLAELSDLGVSNPVNKAAELVTRVKGFEQWAAQDGGEWQAMFYTLTAPSRFHSHDSRGNEYPLWREAGCLDPRAAQAWLCDVWELFRAELARMGLRVFGMRVAEPHHDGCPHWHIALWIPKGRVQQFNNAFFFYAIGADNDLPPTEAMLKRRLKIEKVKEGINPDTGEPYSMVGYILKYITKNVSGVKNDGQEFEAGAIGKALRVEAWASVWGIRQFQQIGGAPVTVWRELRRIDSGAAQDIVDLWSPANAGDWCGFTEAMGGATCKRKDERAAVVYSGRESEEGEIVENAYGEAVRAVVGLDAFEVVHGVAEVCRFWIGKVITRLHTWRVFLARAKPAQLGLVSITVPGGKNGNGGVFAGGGGDGFNDRGFFGDNWSEIAWQTMTN